MSGAPDRRPAGAPAARPAAVFVEAAAVAATLAAAATAASLVVGFDAHGRRAAALGLLAALAVARPLARRVPFARATLAAAGWAAIVLLTAAPDGVGEVLRRIPLGLPSLVLASALVFLFPAARAALALDALGARSSLPLALAGAAAGLALHELALVPLAGQRVAALAWTLGLALVPSGSLAPAERAPLARIALALAAGALLGASLDVASLFVFQYLSGTAFSRTLVAVVVVAGLGLGALLARLAPTERSRSISAGVALPLAPVLLLLALASIANARLPETIGYVLASGGAAVELAVVLAILGGPSLLLGVGLGVATVAPRRAASGLVVGLVAGLHLGVLALPAPIEEACVRRRGRDMVVEHAIAEDGVFERIRSFSRPGSAVAHWNRDAISRSAEWDGLARAEIAAMTELAAAHGGDSELLVVGSPTPAHAEAIAASGFAHAARVDRVPGQSPDSPPLRTAEPFRHASRVQGGHSSVVVLSKPVLERGDGLRLAREGFRSLGSLVLPRGALVVWLDPGALPPRAAERVLRAFFGEFPDGSLLVAQVGLYGPLFGLSSLPAAGALVSGKSLLERLGPGPAEQLDRPGVEAGLPLATRRSERASAPALREWAEILSPLVPDEAAVLEALALVSAADPGARPANPFEEPIDALVIPADALELMTTSLEREPGSRGIRNLVASTGRALLAQRDSDSVLRFGPRWVAARPQDAEILYIVGRQHADLLDSEHALPLLERAAALDPGSAEIAEALAACRASAPPR